MTQRLLIVLFSALIFGAGFAARMWTERDAAVPPVPAAIGSEFSRSVTTSPEAKSAKKASPRGGEQSVDRAKLVKEIDRYSKEITTYRAHLDEIDAAFDRDLAALMTKEQRERYAARQKRDADRRAKGEAAFAADTAPLSDEQIFRLQQRPLYSMLGAVSLTMRFDSLTKDLKLDEAQQAKLRDLLRVRREKFIALVDTTPPPSILLSRLAPVAQKLAAEPKK